MQLKKRIIYKTSKKERGGRLVNSLRHPRIPKSFRNIVITAVILAVVLLIAGGFYSYFTSRQPIKSDTDLTSTSTDNYQPVKPVSPSPNAPEGVALNTLSSPVSWGSEATLEVSTNPTSKCTVTLLVNNIPSPTLGLEPETADSFGTVSWMWAVKNTVPLGTWILKVTCLYNGRTGVVDGNITITKPAST